MVSKDMNQGLVVHAFCSSGLACTQGHSKSATAASRAAAIKKKNILQQQDLHLFYKSTSRKHIVTIFKQLRFNSRFGIDFFDEISIKRYKIFRSRRASLSSLLCFQDSARTGKW